LRVPVDIPSPDELRSLVRREIAYWDRALRRVGLADSME